MSQMKPTNIDFSSYTRVSEVLSYFVEPKLIEWMLKNKNTYKKTKKYAMKVGTEVDLAIKEFVISGKYGKVKTVEGQSCLDGFKKWFDDYHPPLRIGKRLFNEELKVTGEPDLYYFDRIIDIKCSSEVRPKYHLQTAAYSWLETSHLETGILRLHKALHDYEYVQRDASQVSRDLTCFFSLLSIYRYFNPIKNGESNANHPSDNTF